MKSEVFYAICDCCSLIHPPKKFDNFAAAEKYAYDCIMEHNNTSARASVVISNLQQYEKSIKFTYRLEPITKVVICEYPEEWQIGRVPILEKE